jgi:hypothetical protein
MPRLKDEIITFRSDRLREYPKSDYRSFLAIFHAKSGLGPLPAVDPNNMGPSAMARVDLGRWLVDCGACANAVVIDDEDLVFICPRCGSGGRWREVVMPSERVEIEEILLMRPGFRDATLNRFWFPGETTDQLADENFAHGNPVPPPHQRRIEAEIIALDAIERQLASEMKKQMAERHAEEDGG